MAPSQTGSFLKTSIPPSLRGVGPYGRSGFRSVHAAGRFRIIYKIDKKTVIVYVLAAGIRKEGDKQDIYKIAKKLLNAGLLDLKVD